MSRDAEQGLCEFPNGWNQKILDILRSQNDRGILFAHTLHSVADIFNCRHIGQEQIQLINGCRRIALCCHISDGVDPVGAAKVFRAHPRPNDGGDQGGAVLRNTQLAVISIQVILDCQIAGSQVFQNSRIQGTVRCHGLPLCHIQLVPGSITVSENNSGEELLDSQTAVRFITDDIGRCFGLAAGVVIVEPVVGKTHPGELAVIFGKTAVGEMIDIGIGIPLCFHDEGVRGDGIGVKDCGSRGTVVLACGVPWQGFPVLQGAHDTAMGVVTVVALIVPVVDNLHGYTGGYHVAGTTARRIASTTAVTGF